MSIVTRTGDEGQTGLRSGERVWKDDPRVEAYGDLDELSSLLGLARQAARLPATAAAIETAQRVLSRAAGELASVGTAFGSPVSTGDEEAITAQIAELESRVPLKGFVLPGRTEASARLDVAPSGGSSRSRARRVRAARWAPRSGATSTVSRTSSSCSRAPRRTRRARSPTCGRETADHVTRSSSPSSRSSPSSQARFR
jgi:ATP:cob(I)alamin adenosyltransferase